MVSVLASSVVNRGFKPRRIKSKTVAFPLSTQYSEVGTKTGWIGVIIMCHNRATCLSVECKFSKLAL